MMEIWYTFVNHFLPFSWTHHTFMKNALLAVLLVGDLLSITLKEVLLPKGR